MPSLLLFWKTDRGKVELSLRRCVRTVVSLNAQHNSRSLLSVQVGVRQYRYHPLQKPKFITYDFRVQNPAPQIYRKAINRSAGKNQQAVSPFGFTMGSNRRRNSGCHRSTEIVSERTYAQLNCACAYTVWRRSSLYDLLYFTNCEPHSMTFP